MDTSKFHNISLLEKRIQLNWTWRIRVKDKDLSWTLTSDSDGTQVGLNLPTSRNTLILHPQITLIDDEDDDPSFGLNWIFIKIDS